MNMINIILITVGLTIIGAISSLLLKIGSARFKINFMELIKNKALIAGLTLYVFASIIFMVILKYAELSYIYPFVSLSYVWACLLSIRFLNEKMNVYKWAGIVLIIIGVSFVGLGS